jgi:hypothetical protein
VAAERVSLMSVLLMLELFDLRGLHAVWDLAAAEDSAASGKAEAPRQSAAQVRAAGSVHG